jgi:hypothetical protein
MKANNSDHKLIEMSYLIGKEETYRETAIALRSVSGIIRTVAKSVEAVAKNYDKKALQARNKGKRMRVKKRND